MDNVEKIKLIHDLYKIHDFLCKQYINNKEQTIYKMIIIINKVIKEFNE